MKKIIILAPYEVCPEAETCEFRFDDAGINGVCAGASIKRDCKFECEIEELRALYNRKKN